MSENSPSAQVAEVKIDELVERYIKLRDKEAAIKKRHKTELEPIQAAMANVEKFLLGQLRTMGVESVKTKFGTPYIQKHTSVTIGDKPLFFEHVKTQEDWDLLDVRVSKTATLDYMKEHENALPPGLNYSESFVLNVQRS